MPSPPAYDAFLSYNSLDHAIVERVAKELGNRQCKCFVDRWYLEPGKDWVDALAAAIRGEPVDRDGKPAPRAMICPYRGLLAFREEDADFFFGRQKYTDDLMKLVAQHSIVAVTGASGSGKS